MFDKLRSVLKGFASRVATREIKAKELEGELEDLKISLAEADVAYEVAEAVADALKRRLVGTRAPRGSDLGELVLRELRRLLGELLAKCEVGAELCDEIRRLHADSGRPVKVVFLGVNGVGKTTTIAKVALRLKLRGVTPVVAAADTFRAGAQEQLKAHAVRINVPIVSGRYGADPAALAYDAVKHAEARGYGAVLIDTAGRMHVDEDLVEELKKVVRVVKPDYKVLVVDALTGNDVVEQARLFDRAVGVSGVILTKVDADAKGGAALSLAGVLGKPIYYVGTGQRYEDLEPFSSRWVIDRLLGE